MTNGRIWLVCAVFFFGISGCPTGSSSTNILKDVRVGGKSITGAVVTNNISTGIGQIEIEFTDELDAATVTALNITLKSSTGSVVPITLAVSGNFVFATFGKLSSSTTYSVELKDIKTKIGTGLGGVKVYTFNTTALPELPDEDLLTTVQKQTFKYFWDIAGTVSGMARERNSENYVTTGGTGFGLMSIVVGCERGFVTRANAAERVLKVVSYLKHKAKRYHGAWSHWIEDATGQTKPFSEKDNGADLVETSFLMQGMLTTLQYFNSQDNNEKLIRQKVDSLWKEVEWTWFQKDGGNQLYWHWSENYGWAMNFPIQGYNESLIIYLLAASSPTYPIAKSVYDVGWARSGGIKNGRSFYNVRLPLGEDNGGPLFFAHYSYLGLDPRKVRDQYADYWEQNVAHAKINYNYCVANPKRYIGYSSSSWGLTASDNPDGYAAHSPSNDNGTISPTAALSSFPYTPKESMAALRYFYYSMGDKIFKEYGFVDAFNLSRNWYATSFLAIDQGPIIVMIENFRTQLIWNLFMSHPDIQSGLVKLGFTIKAVPEKIESY